MNDFLNVLDGFNTIRSQYELSEKALLDYVLPIMAEANGLSLNGMKAFAKSPRVVQLSEGVLALDYGNTIVSCPMAVFEAEEPYKAAREYFLESIAKRASGVKK